MDRNTAIRLVATACALLLSSSATAQEFTQGVRSGGMGEAFTSVATGSSAIYHNPAGAARAVMYAVEGSYEYSSSANVLSAAIVDSKTNPSIAAGLGYAYQFGNGDSDVRGHDIRVALAIPVLPDRISIGLGGRWLILKDTVTTQNEDGEDVQTDVELMNGPTFDAGIIVKATDQLHFGIAGQNLIDQCSKPECAAIAPTTITGGVSFGTEVGLLLSGDVGVNLTTAPDPALEAGIGAEFLIQQIVPLRAGYMYRGALEEQLLTFGAGWRSAAAGVDLGYQLDLTDTSNMYFMGSFSIYM